MVIQYCRHSSVYRELSSCANMPAEVKRYRSESWAALQEKTPDCSSPIRRLYVTRHSTAGHTKPKRTSGTGNSLYTRPFPKSKPMWFSRNQRDVRAFKHDCISRYKQESARLSCFSSCALWHISELLKALPCPLSGLLTCDTHSLHTSACSSGVFKAFWQGFTLKGWFCVGTKKKSSLPL